MVADEAEFGFWVAALRALLAERKAKAANFAAGELKMQADAAAAAIAVLPAAAVSQPTLQPVPQPSTQPSTQPAEQPATQPAAALRVMEL